MASSEDVAAAPRLRSIMGEVGGRLIIASEFPHRDSHYHRVPDDLLYTFDHRSEHLTTSTRTSVYSILLDLNE